ncbi:MAG TPA: tetraacyldisaccharide 4'-kinase [Flavobacteriales bacterium]|nr:tetraacyldisaccharide 4'-kinase [Flavobacteriales bacterium]
MLQVKRRFPNIPVAVCESRLEGAKRIREECPNVNLLLLDDAYQHRYIVRDVNILLTTYKRPYFNDYLLPMGNLREFRYGKKRAHIIVVTKCPPGSTRRSLRKYFRRIRASGKQYATFTMNAYDEAMGLFDNQANDLKAYDTCLLVTGIANNRDLIEHLESLDKKVVEMRFKDHADYTKNKVNSIVQRYEELSQHSSTCIITTQKDAVKLQEWSEKLGLLPVFSISFSFVLDKNHELKRWILPRILR